MYPPPCTQYLHLLHTAKSVLFSTRNTTRNTAHDSSHPLLLLLLLCSHHCCCRPLCVPRARVYLTTTCTTTMAKNKGGGGSGKKPKHSNDANRSNAKGSKGGQRDAATVSAQAFVLTRRSS